MRHIMFLAEQLLLWQAGLWSTHFITRRSLLYVSSHWELLISRDFVKPVMILRHPY